MLSTIPVEFLKRLTKALAEQFGTECEVLVHDLTENDQEHSIYYIENGHVTHRKVGDGPSEVVFNALARPDVQDEIGYCTTTEDGRLLRSSTIYIRNDTGQVEGILSINYDLSKFLMVQQVLGEWV
ncbi:MAG: PAS domain-containing protein, partial [Niameybacter sp.]